VRLHVTLKDEKQVNNLTSALQTAGIQVTEIETILPSLEDVFINMVESRLKTNPQDSFGG
jgi:hypothetical protein